MEKRGMRYGFVAMLFSMLIALVAFAPSTAFADELSSVTVNTAGELNAAIADNDKAIIVLGQDIEAKITVPAGKEITIDLNGKTLLGADGAVIDNYGSLLLKNGTVSLTSAPSSMSTIWVNKTAKLTVNNDVKVTAPDNSFCVSYWSDCTSAEVTLAGTLSGGNGVTVNGMIPEGTSNTLNIDGANINVSGHGVYLAGAASTNIKNSTIKGSTGVEVRAGNLVVANSEIAGGENFTTQSNPGGTTTEGAGIVIAQHTTKQAIDVTVNGGTISGNYAIYEGNPQTNSPEDVAKINLSLTGGIFDGNVSAEDVKGFVSGGTFTDAAVLKYVKSGNAAKKSQDGDFTILPEEQAKSEAAAKVQNGDSVIYFANIEDAKKFAEDNHIDPSFVEQLRFVITYVDGLTDAAYGLTCTVPAGQKLTKAAIDTPDGEELVPAKEGYTFTGWYLDKELTQKVTFPFEPSSDMELYAGFSKNDPAVNPSQGDNKTTTTTTKTSSAKTGDNLALFGGLLALIAAAGATTAVVAVRRRKSE